MLFPKVSVTLNKTLTVCVTLPVVTISQGTKTTGNAVIFTIVFVVAFPASPV